MKKKYYFCIMKKLVFLILSLPAIIIAQSQLEAPKLLQTHAEPCTVFLQWTPDSLAVGYEVIVVGQKQYNYYVGNNEITITENIQPGCMYSIYIRAYAFDNNAHSTQTQYHVLTPPSALPAKVTSDGFIAVWKRKLKINQYRIEVSKDSTFTQIVSPYNGLYTYKKRFKVSPLSSGVYYYRIFTTDQRQQPCYSNIIKVNVQ